MSDTFSADLAQARKLADQHLIKSLDKLNWHPFVVEDAIYIIQGAGKALRPSLVFFAFESVVGGVSQYPEFLLDCALAVEMIHSYSLIHDDLPAMDNDDLRRGKATLHKKYNEARAILSGDALLTGAFEILSQSLAEAEKRAEAVLVLSRAAGAKAMISGQMRDIFETNMKKTMEQNLEALERVHLEKTGALIAASLELGLVAADAQESLRKSVVHWGLKLGLLFQVIDDVLDATQNSQILGKSAGKDQLSEKRTYVSVLGLDQAQKYSQKLKNQLINEAAIFPFSEKAVSIVEFVSVRNF